jgi:hypothetical protein
MLYKLYHGTHKKFRRFKLPENVRGCEFPGLGIHFGTKKQAIYAIKKQVYADVKPKSKKGEIHEIVVNIQNPLRLLDLEMWESRDIASTLAKIGLFSQQEAQIIKHAFISKTARKKDLYQFRKAISWAGYDAIVYENKYEGDGDSYIIWNFKQIRKHKIEKCYPLPYLY